MFAYDCSDAEREKQSAMVFLCVFAILNQSFHVLPCSQAAYL